MALFASLTFFFAYSTLFRSLLFLVVYYFFNIWFNPYFLPFFASFIPPSQLTFFLLHCYFTYFTFLSLFAFFPSPCFLHLFFFPSSINFPLTFCHVSFLLSFLLSSIVWFLHFCLIYSTFLSFGPLSRLLISFFSFTILSFLLPFFVSFVLFLALFLRHFMPLIERWQRLGTTALGHQGAFHYSFCFFVFAYFTSSHTSIIFFLLSFASFAFFGYLQLLPLPISFSP